MPNDHQLEVLSDALTAAQLAGDFHDCDDPRAWIKADNRLLDACYAAGMSQDTVLHRVWAAEQVASWFARV